MSQEIDTAVQSITQVSVCATTEVSISVEVFFTHGTGTMPVYSVTIQVIAIFHQEVNKYKNKGESDEGEEN